MGLIFVRTGLTILAFGQPSLKTKQFRSTKGKISKKMVNCLFQGGLNAGERTKWSSGLLTEKSSQHGSQNSC